MSTLLPDPNDWHRNVGSPGNPVSYLHEYAVGILWDRLSLGLGDRSPISGTVQGDVRVVMANGETSGNLLADGVEHVVLPDSLQPIGGYIPDLALMNADYQPVRVIEVAVTSYCSPEKVAALTNRGVEVIEVVVRNEQDLRLLCHAPFEGSKLIEDGNLKFSQTTRYKSIKGPDKEIDSLIATIVAASPHKRRELVQVLDELRSLGSLFPLSKKNPKAQLLQNADDNDA